MRLLLFLFLFNYMTVQGQNLVSNSGFEYHLLPLQRLQQATFLENAEFSRTVQGWESIASANMSALFSTKYKANKWQTESLGYSFDKCKPHTGHSMIRLWITPKGGKCGTGSGGNIQTKLIEPLDTSGIYSVSFWVHILKSDGTFYFPDFPKNFGIAFSENKFKLSNPECMLNSDSPFLVDSVKFGQWYRLEFLIKPRSTIKYVVVGAFYNPNKPYAFPDDGHGMSYYFYIDDFDIHAIKSADSIDFKDVHAYPLSEMPSANTSKSISKIIYFDTNQDTLSAIAYQALDSIAFKLNQDKSIVLLLNGHTDNVGKYNRALSRRRALHTRDYLMSKGRLPEYRFKTNGFGSDSTVANNQTEYGRTQNRRVEIQEFALPTTTLLYQLASKAAMSNQKDSAIFYLIEWLNFNSSDGMLLLHDPDLAGLHSMPSWKKIETRVKSAYIKYKNPELSYRLDNLYFKDQRYRSVGNLFEEAKGYVPIGIDSINSINNPVILALDSINASEAFQYIEKLSWPDQSIVGKRQADAIFYAIQHSSDLTKMKKSLPYLEKACNNNKSDWEKYAMLYDRILLKETGFQRYGTQYKADENDLSLYKIAPLENPGEIDQLRAKVGLPPLDISSSYRMKPGH